MRKFQIGEKVALVQRGRPLLGYIRKYYPKERVYEIFCYCVDDDHKTPLNRLEEGCEPWGIEFYDARYMYKMKKGTPKEVLMLTRKEVSKWRSEQVNNYQFDIEITTKGDSKYLDVKKELRKFLESLPLNRKDYKITSIYMQGTKIR